jgi:hypothetical protein
MLFDFKALMHSKQSPSDDELLRETSANEDEQTSSKRVACPVCVNRRRQGVVNLAFDRLRLAAPCAVAPRNAFQRQEGPVQRASHHSSADRRDPLRALERTALIELVRAQSAIMPLHQPAP